MIKFDFPVLMVTLRAITCEGPAHKVAPCELLCVMDALYKVS
jgi:hypothetical protein